MEAEPQPSPAVPQPEETRQAPRRTSRPHRAPVVPPVVLAAGQPSVDLPTQAGMPVFHDDDEVDWLRARTEPAAPPPPLDELPPKPLFAPDPPDGQPVRRARPGSRAADVSQEYWPWDSSRDSSGTPPAGRDTGSWTSGSWPDDRWGTGEGMDDTGEQVPGRNWIRLAMIVGVCVLVMVAAVAAYQLGLKPPAPGDDTPLASGVADAHRSRARRRSPTWSPSTSTRRAPSRARRTPTRVPNALDGDPATVVDHLDLRAELRSQPGSRTASA